MLSIAAGLSQVLEFMYTAKLSLTPDNFEDVMAVANFLQMQELVNACSMYQSVTDPAPSHITMDVDQGESSLFAMVGGHVGKHLSCSDYQIVFGGTLT